MMLTFREKLLGELLNVERGVVNTFLGSKYGKSNPYTHSVNAKFIGRNSIVFECYVEGDYLVLNSRSEQFKVPYSHLQLIKRRYDKWNRK